MTSTAHKEESEVKLDLKSNDEEEEEEEVEEVEEEEQEQDEIIDLDFEDNPKQEAEEKKEEIKVPEVVNVLDSVTENNFNHHNEGTITETKNNKTCKKTFFTPKNQTMLGKIFINTTTANTEENANFTKTDGNNPNKTAITMVSRHYLS